MSGDQPYGTFPFGAYTVCVVASDVYRWAHFVADDRAFAAHHCNVDLVAFAIPGECRAHYISRPCPHGLIFSHPDVPWGKLKPSDLGAR